MASKSGQKVRLVKCPKCLKILQEDEDVPVYQCGGCSTILQARRRTIPPKTTPSAGGAEGAQASEPRSEPVTNNVSSSSEQDTVLPSPTDHSTDQVDKKALDGSLESTDKQLRDSIGEDDIQLQDHSLGDLDKKEGEDNSSSRLKSDIKPVAEDIGQGTSSGSLNADHLVDASSSYPSSDAYRKLEAEISPDASSPVEEEQNEDDYFSNRHRESTDDLPAGNKTCSTYDGSESSSDEREDELLSENEQWKALQEISSGKFQMQRYPESFKEQSRGSSSSTTFSEKRPNATTTTYMERYQNRSMQLEGPGGRLRGQGRRHVTEQLRPSIPVYPREPYTRVSPSYPSQDEFDHYSRAHSLQMPPYAGDMNYHNNTRARGRGQGSRFSGEMTNDRRNHPGWYSGQLHSSYSSYPESPQGPMEQPAYYPRWSHEIVSDAEDHQRNRHAGGHHHDLQAHRLKERQRVAKRHIRPTAGGAPFVSCYSCSENLQLPVDFLIFKRKYHLLRCGRCNTVLRFSLQSRTHLVPAGKRDTNANRSSKSTSESLRVRDKAPSKQPEKPSSSAQEEEVPVARGSPLHRLMGYSTVSQVFKASQRPPSL